MHTHAPPFWMNQGTERIWGADYWADLGPLFAWPLDVSGASDRGQEYEEHMVIMIPPTSALLPLPQHTLPPPWLLPSTPSLFQALKNKQKPATARLSQLYDPTQLTLFLYFTLITTL